MAYQNLHKFQGLETLSADGGNALNATAGAAGTGFVLGIYVARRPAQILGFGLAITLAGTGAVTTQPVIHVSKQLAAGGALADIAGWSLALTTAQNVAGGIGEVSALRKPFANVAPDAYVAPVDAAAGDIISIYLFTASNYATTPPKGIVYLLVAPYGAL